MDKIGYRVGWVLAERFVYLPSLLDYGMLRLIYSFFRLAKDKPRIPRSTQSASNPPPPDPLEVIKFVCKDLYVLKKNKNQVFVSKD